MIFVDIILESLGELFVEFFFKKVSMPFLIFTGSLIRWLLCLGTQSYETISNKKYNGRIGLLFWLTITGFVVYFLINQNYTRVNHL